MKKGIVVCASILLMLCLRLENAEAVVLFSDNFNNNSIESFWTTDLTGAGSIVEQNQQMEMTIRGDYQNPPKHARLGSNTFDAGTWTTLDFSGQWKMAPTYRTAEFDIGIFDANDPSKYILIAYQSWGGPNIRMTDSGTQKYYASRAMPTSALTDFSILIDSTGWEFWEGGSLVNSFASTSLASTTDFYIRIGGYDFSNVAGQQVIFDNIVVQNDVQPSAVIPEPSTLLLLGTGIFGQAFRRKKKGTVSK